MTALAVTLVLMLSGCSQPGKPTNPAEFAEAWLAALADLESGGNCDRVTNWISPETRQTWYPGDCHSIRTSVSGSLGGEVTKQTTFDCHEVTRPTEAEQGQTRLECAGSVPAAVFLVGPPDDWKIFTVSPN